MFAAIDIMEHFACYRAIPEMVPRSKYYVMRTAVVLLTGLVAISIPKFGLFLDFLGAFGGTFLCFIFPIMFCNKVFAESMETWRKLVHIGILVIGCFLGIISAIASGTELISEIFILE